MFFIDTLVFKLGDPGTSVKKPCRPLQSGKEIGDKSGPSRSGPCDEKLGFE
jgi:hypothetical protein